MKTKISLSLSIVTIALLFTSTALFASSYKDSLSNKETKVLNNPSSVQSNAAEAQVEESISKEAFLAKVKLGDFKKEANIDETKRLNNVVNNAVQAHKNSLQKAPKEFMIGLNNTIMALQAIKTGKIKEAQKLLTSADKEFEKAFKKDPKLGLIPVADNAEIIAFNGSPRLINYIKDSAIKLLQDNDTQIAINMLMPLQDEIIIKTQYVPAYLYPNAVKKAVKELNIGKKDAAFKTIVAALDTAQLETVMIPIPLITAQDMLLEASKLKKSHKKEALKLLTMAQTELQKAKLLGYTHEYQQSYQNLERLLKAIKTEIKGKNIVTKLYDEVLKEFKDLGDKHKKI